MRFGDYSSSALTILAAVLIVLGGALIFVIDLLGGLLVIAGAIIGFGVLFRYVREQYD